MSINTAEWDELDDDAFLDALDDASYEPVEDNTEETDHTDSEPDETYSEAETNEQIDDEVQDSVDDEESYEEDQDGENTQIESSEENTDDESGSDNNTETDNQEDGETSGSDKQAEINYEDEYKKIMEEKAWFEDFYNQATSEFVANGRKVRGFDDPKKIIESQQMAAGFSEKMSKFKEYRPFMNTLKEKGILDNPDKFNLAMSLLDGDPEALKKQIKDAGIDPFEMDMEKINYQEKNAVSSNIEIALDDVMQSASQYGVDDEVRNVISNDWDDESIIELLEDPENSSDLVKHISSGAYDVVKDRMAEKSRVDVNGIYAAKSSIEKYREAAYEIENEYLAYLDEQQQMQQQQIQPQEQQYYNQNEINIANQVEQQKYAEKVERENAKTNEARRKATSLSKQKRGSRKPKGAPDPLSLDDQEFTDYLDSLIYN